MAPCHEEEGCLQANQTPSLSRNRSFRIAHCSCIRGAIHRPQCCMSHIPWPEGNAGWSILTRRDAQQVMHAKTQVHKDQFAVDIARHIGVSLFQSVSE